MPEGLAAALDLAPADALVFFRAKGLRITGPWTELTPAEHARSFTVAHCARLDVLADIRAALDAALAQGTPYSGFKKALKPLLIRKGWWGPAIDTATGEVLASYPGTSAPVMWGSPRRLQTIFDSNLQSAYMAGRYRQMSENAAARPYWEYVATLDARTRPAHAALNGKVLPADDPAWRSLYPPNGYRCRCRVVARAADEIAPARVQSSAGHTREVPLPLSTRHPDAAVVTVTQVKLPGMDEWFSPDPGWSGNPAATVSWADLAVWDKARGALPPALAAAELERVATHPLRLAAFDAWVDETLARGAARGQEWVIGYLAPPEADWLAGQQIQVANGAIVLNDRLLAGPKAGRHADAGNALSPAEWKSVARRLVEPQAVLFDRDNGTLLYVLPSEDERKVKLVVEAGRVEKKRPAHESVRSVFKVRTIDLAKDVDAERLTLVRGVL